MFVLQTLYLGFKLCAHFLFFFFELLALFPTDYMTQRCGNVVLNRGGKKHFTNYKKCISPMCHLHFTSNSLPHIISVTESGRMQLQVVLKLLWGAIDILTAWKPLLLCLLWGVWYLMTPWDVLDSCLMSVFTKDLIHTGPSEEYKNRSFNDKFMTYLFCLSMKHNFRHFFSQTALKTVEDNCYKI